MDQGATLNATPSRNAVLPDPAAALTKRQLECLRGVADHLDSYQIAHRLGISKHTVDGHIAAAVQALGARSRREAAVKMFPPSTLASDPVTGDFPPVGEATDDEQVNDVGSAVREPPAPHYMAEPPDRASLQKRGTEDAVEGGTLRTLVSIVVIALGIALLLVATEPLVNGARNLANAIMPPNR